MKKVMKLFSIVLVILFVFTLTGCELSLEDISEKYDIDKEIQAEEVTEEELLQKFKDIINGFKDTNYSEMLMVGKVQGEEVSIKMQYDFSSDDIEEFEFYLSLNSPEGDMIVFIEDGVIYVDSQFGDSNVKEKQKISEALGNINIEEVKDEILDEAMSNFGMDLVLDKESYEDLIDSIKEELVENKDSIKAQIDSKDNLIIDYIEYSGQGRIVFNSDNKLIYIGVKGLNDNMYMSMTINYSKPNIKMPSKDGYKEVAE